MLTELKWKCFNLNNKLYIKKLQRQIFQSQKIVLNQSQVKKINLKVLFRFLHTKVKMVNMIHQPETSYYKKSLQEKLKNIKKNKMLNWIFADKKLQSSKNVSYKHYIFNFIRFENSFNFIYLVKTFNIIIYFFTFFGNFFKFILKYILFSKK